MPDYAAAKIYAIRSNQTDKYYIGSTTRPLGVRFSAHKYAHAQLLKGGIRHSCRSIEILKHDDAYIELIEEYPCETKEELHAREGELIRAHREEIVNKARPARTKEEYLEYLREWRASHPDYQKAWRETHPGYMKAWRAKKKLGTTDNGAPQIVCTE